MKKSVVFLLVGFVFVISTLPAAAYEFGISVGDRISFTSYDTSTGGGEFNWTSQDDGYSFQSFCVETHEFVSPNKWYYVGEISDSASSTTNPLSDQTAWLYWNFANGTLPGYNGVNNQTELQKLIWSIETSQNYTYTNLMTDWDNLYAASTWTNNGRVRVANLYKDFDSSTGIYSGSAQDALIKATHTPEPTTMILFGFGLIGFAALGRKTMKKNQTVKDKEAMEPTG